MAHKKKKRKQKYSRKVATFKTCNSNCPKYDNLNIHLASIISKKRME